MLYCPPGKRGEKMFRNYLRQQEAARRQAGADAEARATFERGQLAMRVLDLAVNEVEKARSERDRARVHREIVGRQEIIKRQIDLVVSREEDEDDENLNDEDDPLGLAQISSDPSSP